MIVLGLVFAGVGILCLAIGVQGIAGSLRFRRWPVAVAEIVSARVVAIGRAGRWGRLEVEYLFQAEGRTRTGRGVHPRMPSFGTRDDIEALCGLLSPGARIEARWNPQRPDFAWLDVRILPEQWFLVWFGSLFLAAGLFVAAFEPLAQRLAHLSVIGTLQVLP